MADRVVSGALGPTLKTADKYWSVDYSRTYLKNAFTNQIGGIEDICTLITAAAQSYKGGSALSQAASAPVN